MVSNVIGRTENGIAGPNEIENRYNLSLFIPDERMKEKNPFSLVGKKILDEQIWVHLRQMRFKIKNHIGEFE